MSIRASSHRILSDVTYKHYRQLSRVGVLHDVRLQASESLRVIAEDWNGCSVPCGPILNEHESGGHASCVAELF